MESIIIRKADPKDYPAIIELQNKNTPDKLSEKEKEQGFVVSDMTEETLHQINESIGVLVALEGEVLAGFVCLTATDSLPEHPVIESMCETFPQQIFNNKSLIDYKIFLYGPVLIDPKWRGRGIFKKIFSAVKEYSKKDYNLGVAFINDKNKHSLSAHLQGLGMTPLQPFKSGNESFQLVVFPV